MPMGRSVGKWPWSDHHTEQQPAVRLAYAAYEIPPWASSFPQKCLTVSSACGLHLHYSPLTSGDLFFLKNFKQLQKELYKEMHVQGTVLPPLKLILRLALWINSTSVVRLFPGG